MPTTEAHTPPRLVASRGELPKIQIRPTGLDNVDEVGAQYKQIREELNEVDRKLRKIRSDRGRRRAEALDADAFRQARLDDAKDPGPKHVRAWTAEVADLERKSAGLRLTVAELAGRYGQPIAEHRSEIVEKARGAVAAPCSAAPAVLERLGAILDEYADATHFARWVDAGPEWNGGRRAPTVKIGDDQVAVADVIAALVEHLDAGAPFEMKRSAGVIESRRRPKVDDTARAPRRSGRARNGIAEAAGPNDAA